MRTTGPASLILVIVVVALVSSAAYAQSTLDIIRTRGAIKCGVGPDAPGFFQIDASGHTSGLSVDICRAISAAIFGVPNKAVFVPLSPAERFVKLRSGEIDVLTRNAPWTLHFEATEDVLYGPVVFYAGQTFLVPKRLGLGAVRDLADHVVCVSAGTSTQLNVEEYSRANGIHIVSLPVRDGQEGLGALAAGRCEAIGGQVATLMGLRGIQPNPDDFVVLPESIAKEYLAPVTRRDDPRFFALVRWTILALIAAEEKGITSENALAMQRSADPEIARLLGASPGIGTALGIDDAWVANMVHTVGNYGEIFDRNLGEGSSIKMKRGLNDLWFRGGLMSAPPIQ